ncbi:hypothetical protein EDD18DRAFT_1112011 [Armillaria luteobubalina]|uniref:Uncharacterized protein n=1 Tax=Armillaria luteobubalina TaxID=153913 RepID=A0AA39PH66_9AGAR|nr:hypothetical protein EDD18DRAFT_1112011 [Armillaria luteobubalina]
MDSAARSRQTDQPTCDRVAVLLLSLPFTTTWPTMTLHTTDVLFRTQLKQATDDDDDDNDLVDDDDEDEHKLCRGLVGRSTCAVVLWDVLGRNERPRRMEGRARGCGQPTTTTTNEPFWESMQDPSTEGMRPTPPIRPHNHAHRWHPPPCPTSPSPTPPRTHTDSMSMHLPLFEWGNTTVTSVFSPDPTVTHRPPTIPNPALSVVPPVLLASSVSRNLTTTIFDTRESNSTTIPTPFSPLAVERLSQPTPNVFAAHKQTTGPIATDGYRIRRATCSPPTPHLVTAPHCT